MRVPGDWGSPRFQDNWHMMVVRLSTIRTGRLYPPGNISGSHISVRGWVNRRVTVRPEGLCQWETLNDTIGNRTCDPPACSAVPQPTAPPRTPWGYVNGQTVKQIRSFIAKLCPVNWKIWKGVLYLGCNYVSLGKCPIHWTSKSGRIVEQCPIIFLSTSQSRKQRPMFRSALSRHFRCNFT